MVRYAVEVWSTSPVRTFSDSIRTPTSIEVRQAALTVAFTVTSWPTNTGCRKLILSIAAVTTRAPEWRTAAIPATSSQRCMSTPPCTLPEVFASAGPIQRLRIELDADGARGSTRSRRLLLGRLNASDTRRRHARACWTHVDGNQVEDLEDARQGRGSGRDTRLRLPEAD